MLTLGIESSCDDTAAAVLQDDKCLLSNVVSSQDEIHSRFGGVVPELASRNHLESINLVVDKALQLAGIKLTDVDLIAATQGPGLIGSLLVGFSYAKSISYVSKIPLVGVDHMAGHLLSVFLEENKPDFPYIALIVSGGTTSIFLCRDCNNFRLLGRTRDDASGEAFDKVAKLLDLGYPGGPKVAQKAKNGNAQAFSFPRAWLETDSLDFSFSGLKTSVLNQYLLLKDGNSFPIEDICASFQEAVFEVLISKTLLAARQNNISTIVLGGGVSANEQLRKSLKTACHTNGLKLFVPQPVLCTDNGAMIAMAGYLQYRNTRKATPFTADVFSRSTLG